MESKNLRIILSTGGTGGHIFPALAVASALKNRDANTELLFVGALYGKEKEYTAKAGIKFYGLNVRGLKGRGLKALGAGVAMLKAIKESYDLLGEFKPHAVVGFGGYACFATLFAAKLRKIPCIIHEQNAVPGLANKVLAKLVDRICLSVPDEKHIFNPKKSVLTGNPVRAEIAKITPQYKEEFKKNFADKRKQLLIMGGSLGATTINSLVIELLEGLRDNNIAITHQCGSKDYPRVREAYKSYGFSQDEIDGMLFEFIEDMATAYAKADLALCRAGASSIAELTATGTPAIFIPFPHATNDHQTANAEFLVNSKGALLFQERELKHIDIKDIVHAILKDDINRKVMAENCYRFAKIDAAEKVADIIEQSIKQRTLQQRGQDDA